MLPGVGPDAERGLKELLYRCLEELGATKAALYLASSQSSFELVVQYGFGKRDAIAAEIKAGNPLWDWLRRHRTQPAFLNDASEDRTIGPLLEAAGTARLLTVPLTLGDRLIGLVDVRDKARKAQFTHADATAARVIGKALEELIGTLGIYGPVPEPATLEAAALPTPPPAPVAAAPPPEVSPPALHTSIIESVAQVARTVSPLPGVTATAVTVTDGSTTRALLLRAMPLDKEQRDAIAAHQVRYLEELGVRVPPPQRWGWAEEASGGAEKRGEEIYSAVLHAAPPVSVVFSVITPPGSAAGRAVLALVQRHFDLAYALRGYRRAARNLARLLLEPGEAGFPHLRQHSQSVSELAQRMAGALKLHEEEEELVTVGGYLHDVGMRELDYARLYRLDQPAEADKRTYRRHPVVGARIVETAEFPGNLAATIRHHHERWDGNGYPDRLAGRQIPLASRIIHLAEVYDVLTSPASYRRPLAREAALELIRREAGRQFDPELVPLLQEVARA
jgi:putative nucleotidyltransferase with HDIG domain